MTDIRDYSLEELEQIFRKWRISVYHARQVFSWIYQKEAASFDEMTDLSLDLRKRFKEQFIFQELKLIKMRESTDGTKKFLFGLEDDNLIESVLIPAEGRNTACLSTQVGCKYACRFCASGLLGFKRNLAVWEILTQLSEINRTKRGGSGKVSHVVFMGTGEPLDNYENVLKAIRIINSGEGLNIGARRITISTAGVIPGIERLVNEGLQIELSASLHSACDKTRNQLMPINRKYPLKELISACRKYALATGRQVTFEYVLIKDINCLSQDAKNLAKLLKGWLSKVNLLIYNPIEDFSFKAPDKSEALAFKQILQNEGIPVTLRRPRGQDIEGACGQLRLRRGFQ
jgi:23S rRNA (adenine2503-C2)-methyltransferase